MEAGCKHHSQSPMHVNKQTFVKMFKNNWLQYKKVCKPRDIEDEVVNKMVNCGDISNGYTQKLCPGCGRRIKIGFTCKSHFCLSCCRAHLEDWVRKIKSMMLKGIRHRHVVLTTPEKLWRYFKNDRNLLKIAVDSGSDVVKDIIKFHKKKRGIIPGIITVIQTSSRRCTFNVHLHLLMTEGGLFFGKGEERWIPCTFIDSKVLCKKWQYYLLTSLRGHIPQEVIDELFKIEFGFITHSVAQKIRRRDIVGYLIKYVASPPISLRRIVSYIGDKVTYRYTPREGGEREETIHVFRFINLLVQHIPEKWQKMVRYYGIYARNLKSEARRILKGLKEKCKDYPEVVIPEVPDEVFRPLTYAEKMKLYFNKDPCRCTCGQEMITELIVDSSGRIIYDLFDERFHKEVGEPIGVKAPA